MKKNLLKLATAGLLVGALLFSISLVPGGKVSMFVQARAEEQTREPVVVECADETYHIECIVGSRTCLATGTCDDN